MKRIIHLLLLCIFIFSFSNLYSNIITVGPTGDYQKIQDAIDASVDDDEIIVSPGTYNENINFNGKNIILRSTKPTNTSVVESTIINGDIDGDGTGDGSVVTFKGIENETCIISGFSIINGKNDYGSGINGNGNLAMVRYNIICKNSPANIYRDSYGAGIYNCNGIIQNNIISENSAKYGGGIGKCNAIIRNNKIYNNSAGYGAGFNECGGLIQNNIIFNNSASIGGGLCSCNGTIINNTIYGNYANNYGGGLYSCQGFIANNIIWGNSASQDNQISGPNVPFYSCIQDWDGNGRGNISTDPKFLNPTEEDFHISSDSSCRDKGCNYYLFGEYIVDIDSECRIEGNIVDIGADEYGGSIDSDGDLLSNTDESSRGSSINNPDTDGDGLIDGAEILRGTNPSVFDSPIGIYIPSDYSDIQQVVFLAFPLETVYVSPGIYKVNLHFLGKNITLQSNTTFENVINEGVVFDGDKLNSVIFFTGKESQSSIMKGFIISNGFNQIGGGINGNGTMAKIEGNIIINNRASFSGGGIYWCNGAINNNIILNNSSVAYGGGLYKCQGYINNNIISGNETDFVGGALSDCNGIIQDNIIENNSAEYHGGGISLCNGIIQNNVIVNNQATYRGGGIYESQANVWNNTIWNNFAGYQGGGIYNYVYSTITKNNIIWNNNAPEGQQIYSNILPSYSCIQNWSGGTGNLNDDPQLVDPTNGDFHLKATSPCIDAGCYIEGITQDFEGNPRGFNGTPDPRGDGSDYDIGADEYVKYTSVENWSYWLY